MQTIFDWLALIVFAGLAVLFLQRSVNGESMGRVWLYFPAAIGCALSNWLGNNDYPIPAVVVLVASAAYIIHVLKPTMFKL